MVVDGASSHTAKDLVIPDNLRLLPLPPYAPELNPVEYIWAHCKHHELPNVCAKNLWDLGEGARRSLKRMRRRPRLITAFWKQASLFD